jgi:hypothetical protein
MIRRVKRIKPKKRFTPVTVSNPEKTGDELEHLFLPPLQPRKKLFVVLCAVFGVWVALLITLYATTVYPNRHGKSAGQPTTKPVAPEAVPVTVPA